MNQFKINATVITPISIGNGSELSPYKDYFIDNDKVHYIDENKLSQLLAKDPALMDAYVEGVANMDGNRSNFDLKGFVQNHLSINPLDIIRNSIEFRGNSNAKLPINEAIKTPTGRPYIPGSSLKGAIKTALVYTDLEKTDFGNKWKSDFFRQLNHVHFNSGLKENHLLKSLKSQIDELERKLKAKAEIQNKQTNLIERLTVSDSTTLEHDNLSVIDLERTKIPVRREALKVGSNFQFEINSPIDDWGLFQEKLNRFASNNLRYYDDADKSKEKLYNLIENVFDNQTDEAYLAIGFGKGVYLNSILVSLKDFAYDNEKENLFENYLSVLFPKSRNLDIDSFPITEFRTFNKNQALGWIKLERIKY